ncbi:putative ribonuclease H-like domain-containing protein, partial [Tanacetum coccineum]
NRVLVIKRHNKTPYELLLGRPPSISFMRRFGCPVTILKTLDPLSKFNRKADEGFLVGYSINIKAFRVFNTRTRKEKASDHECILLPLMLSNSPLSLSSQSTDNKDADEVPGKGDDDISERNGQEKEEGASNKKNDQHVQDFRAELDNLLVQQKKGYANNTNRVSTVNPSINAIGQGFDNADDQERIDSSTRDVNTIGPSINTASESINTGSSNINTASPIPNDLSMQSLEVTGIFDDAYDDREEVGAEADPNNLETTMNVHYIPTTRIYKDHLIEKIIGDFHSAPLTRRMSQQNLEELGLVLTLVELPKGKRAIGTKWVYRNKKDERGIIVRNKARLVSQEKALYGLHQAPRAWYETLSTYLLENRYRRGTIDKTLFIKKDRDNAQKILDEFYGGAHFLLRIASTIEGGWNLY